MRGANPKLAIWGDSFAAHLIPGIAQKSDITQLTVSRCGPFLDLAPIHGRNTKDWAKKCLQQNQQAFNIIVESKSITHVILSSEFTRYFKGTEGYFLIGDDVVKKNAAVAIEPLSTTIDKLTNICKKVLLVSPPPRSGHNLGDCHERKYKGLAVFRSTCDISVTEDQTFGVEIYQALRIVEQRTEVKIIWLHNILCDEKTCKSKIGNTYIYRDTGHLTITGSEKILGNFDWEQQVSPLSAQ